jgi:hypothetical protein
MSDGERSSIMAENCIEDLADRQERAIDAAFAYRNSPLEVMGSVAHEHDRSLAGGALQLTYRDSGDVLGGSHSSW